MGVEPALGSLGAWLASSAPPNANLQYEHSHNESRTLHGIRRHTNEDDAVRPRTFRLSRYSLGVNLLWIHLSL